MRGHADILREQIDGLTGGSVRTVGDGPAETGGRGGPEAPEGQGAQGTQEAGRVRLNPGLSALLGLVVAAFLAGTAYVSHLPLEHRDLPFDLLEGIVIGGGVGVVSATRGLVMREPAPRPARRPTNRRR